MPGTAKEKLTPEVKQIFKEKRVNAEYSTDKESAKFKYSRVRMIPGYDLLENSILVRPYILERYKIDHACLEILLYLVPKRFFTQKDYAAIPKKFKYTRLNSFMKFGLITVVMQGENIGKKVYCVSRQGVEIVHHYYQCLSGEKKIPDNQSNPMTLPNATAIGKKRMELIRKLQQQPVPDTKRRLFE